MLFDQVTDILKVNPSGTLASLTANQVVTVDFKQEQRRLEAIIVAVGATTGAGAAGNHDGYAGLIKQIRLKVKDVSGDRNMIRVSGPALLSYVRNMTGFIDRQSFRSCSISQIASLAQSVCFFIPVRHMGIAEPYGHVTSLPLSSTFLGGEPRLEIELNPAASVWSAGAPAAATVKVLGIFREVPESLPYVPHELVTEDWTPGSAAKQIYPLDGPGFLASVFVMGYNNIAYSNAIQRISLLAAGGTLMYDYGRQTRRKYDDDFIMCLNDQTQLQLQAVAADNLTNRQYAGEYFIDFLTDYLGQDAFSINSLQNLNTDALSGDKARLVFDTFAGNYLARITTSKFLARTKAALDALKIAI
jgi:hypothetical protein